MDKPNISENDANMQELKKAILQVVEKHEANEDHQGSICWTERCNMVAFMCHVLGVRGPEKMTNVARILRVYDANCSERTDAQHLHSSVN